MFKRVLIAEDHETASISLRKSLQESGVTQTDYVFYCDDALSRIKKQLEAKEPYQLLITDLVFEDDGRKQQIDGGRALVSAARRAQPDLKILVFSAEHRPKIIEQLFDLFKIDGYVRKARRDAQELARALDRICNNRVYYPAWLKSEPSTNSHEFSDFDVTIINLLAKGLRQKDIPAYLAAKKIKPNALSSVEKRLNLIKSTLNFSQNEQMIAFCKDMGII